MACRSCSSSRTRGLPRPARQSTPTSSPDVPSNRTRVQSLLPKAEARAGSNKSAAGADTMASGCRDKAPSTAWLKRRSSNCPWVISPPRPCRTNVSKPDCCWTTSAATSAPIMPAARLTKRLANSGSWSSEFSSSASPIKDSARRRCSSERCRLRVTSRATAACAASARARRMSSWEMPARSSRSSTPNMPNT